VYARASRVDRLAEVGPFLRLGFLAFLLGPDGGLLTLPADQLTGWQEAAGLVEEPAVGFTERDPGPVSRAGQAQSGAREENRTPDLRITSALLCRLSYSGVNGRG
jgi:hypothetical protein